MRQLNVESGKRVFAGARGSLSCLRLAIQVARVTVCLSCLASRLSVPSHRASVYVLVFYSNNNKAQSQEVQAKFQKIEEILHPIQSPSFSLSRS